MPDTQSHLHFGLHVNAWGKLVLIDSDGVRHENVTAVRAFPLSDPQHWVSICNASGAELVCIPDFDQLPPTTRDVLLAALAKSEFMPAIERLVHATHGEPAEWQVLTNRGETRFVLKSVDDIRSLGDGRFIVTDSDGVRYLIPSLHSLDLHSRRTLERFL